MLCTGIPSGQSPETLPGTPRETPTRDPPVVPGKQPGVWPLQYSASGLRGTVPCLNKNPPKNSVNLTLKHSVCKS